MGAEQEKLQFRVENEVRSLQDGEVAHRMKTTTLFDGAFVYDIIGDNGEITIFDKEKMLFTLLEPSLRIQCSLDAKEMKKQVDQARDKMRNNKDAFRAFAVSPKFETTIEKETGLVKFSSRWIEYQITTRPIEGPKLQDAYFDFCDWYCYFNLKVNPGSSTMFARMEVNRSLRQSGRFPEKIQVRVFPKGNTGISGIVNPSQMSESDHVFSLRLVPNDEKKIEAIHEQTKSFRVVSFEEYQKQMNSRL